MEREAEVAAPAGAKRTEGRRRLRGAGAVGVVDGVGAALLYLVGWDRAFSYDASRTVGQFVTARSLGDVFAQDRFNNHPLFSFLEHVVHSATGSADERALRVLPIVCGALAVGLVAAAVARRFGHLAVHVAGVMLALNPMAARQFREVRGYALVTLAVVVGTVALYERLRTSSFPPAAVYVVAMSVAVGTHLFAFAVLAVHALVVVLLRPPRLRLWVGAWAVVATAGLAVQWPALVDGLRTPPQYRFDPTFPVRLAANLLGGAALPGMLVLVVVGWRVLQSRPWARWAAAGTAVILSAAWVAGPSWLDSRFFVWLVPAVAALAGVAVARRPRLAHLAVACAAVQLLVYLHGATRSDVPNRIGAAFIRASQEKGDAACALGRTRAGLLAYVDEVGWAREPAHLAGCDLAVEAAGPRIQPLAGAACERFAYLLTLPAKNPGAVFADQPLPPVPELAAEAPARAGEASEWERTSEAALCREARRR